MGTVSKKQLDARRLMIEQRELGRPARFGTASGEA